MEALIRRLAQEYFQAESLECVSFQQDGGAADYIGSHSKAVSGDIICHKGEQRLSESVFVKYHTTADQSYDFDVRPSFDNEILFYQRICPFLQSMRSVDHLVPKFLAARAESGPEADVVAIMMRRLGPEWVCHHRESLDYNHMSAMVRKLGELHAYSFAARRRHDANQLADLSRCVTNVVVSRQIPAYCPRLVPILQRALRPLRADPRYRAGAARVDRLLRDFPGQVARSFSAEPEAKFAVLGHLSYNQSNVLFRYEGGAPVDLKIVDWQTPSTAPLGADLVRTLYADTDRRVRDVHWDRLLDDYHQALSGTFDAGDTPSRGDLVEALRQSVCAAPFVLGHRVLAMNAETAADGREPSHPVWNDQWLADMFEDLIDRGLV